MIFSGDIFFFSLHLPSPPLSCHILSVEITHLFSAYSYNTVYKVEPPVGEEILTKFENRSALAQDLNLLSGDLHKSLFLFTNEITCRILLNPASIDRPVVSPSVFFNHQGHNIVIVPQSSPVSATFTSFRNFYQFLQLLPVSATFTSFCNFYSFRNFCKSCGNW